MRVEDYGLTVDLYDSYDDDQPDGPCAGNARVRSAIDTYGSYAIDYNGQEICSGSLYSDSVSISFLGAITEFDIGEETTFLDIVEEARSLAERDLKSGMDQNNRIQITLNHCIAALRRT